MTISRRLIAIAIMVVGISLTHQGYTLKKDYEDHINKILEPINMMVDDLNFNSGYLNSFDSDKYMQDNMNRTINLAMDSYAYEGKLMAGIPLIFSGFGLLIIPEIGAAKRFWNRIINFFIG